MDNLGNGTQESNQVKIDAGKYYLSFSNATFYINRMEIGIFIGYGYDVHLEEFDKDTTYFFDKDGCFIKSARSKDGYIECDGKSLDGYLDLVEQTVHPGIGWIAVEKALKRLDNG